MNISTGYVEENDIHVEMDSVGGETNATRMGGKKSMTIEIQKKDDNVAQAEIY